MGVLPGHSNSYGAIGGGWSPSEGRLKEVHKYLDKELTGIYLGEHSHNDGK